MTQDCSNLKRDKHPMPAVRRAVMRDLPTLIEFTAAEAIEAEGSIKAFEILEKGIRAALEDDSKANEMESQNGLELRLYVHRDNKKRSRLTKNLPLKSRHMKSWCLKNEHQQIHAVGQIAALRSAMGHR